MIQLSNAEVVLATQRLRLEPLHAAHARALYPLLRDERIYRYIPTDPPTSRQALAARFRTLEARTSPAGDELWLNWALRKQTPDDYIGRLEATVLADRTAFIAYELAPQYWGQGFAAEACARILEHLEHEYTVTRVLAEVDTRNTASTKLLERLGFERVGFRPAADFFKGSASDEYVYQRALRIEG